MVTKPAQEIHDEDRLDWDLAIQPPPPRRSGTIRVRLIYNGRSKPIPIEADSNKFTTSAILDRYKFDEGKTKKGHNKC